MLAKVEGEKNLKKHEKKALLAKEGLSVARSGAFWRGSEYLTVVSRCRHGKAGYNLS